MSTRSTAASIRGWMSCCARPTTLSLPMMMTDVDRLLRDYIERFEAGGSEDPTDLMEGLEAQDRQKLSVLIDGYLEHAARPQEWDPEAFEGSLPIAPFNGSRSSGLWPARLPGELVRLRNEGKITREDLVASWPTPSACPGRGRRSPPTTTAWSGAAAGRRRFREVWRPSRACSGPPATRSAKAASRGGHRRPPERAPAYARTAAGAIRPIRRSAQASDGPEESRTRAR